MTQLEQKRITGEMHPSSIKKTIAHELSHWASDTTHNRYIDKMLIKAQETDDKNVTLTGKAKIPGQTHYELDATIHGLKQQKRAHSKTWNKMDLKDLIFLDPTLYAIGSQIARMGQKEFDLWQKDLVKRMQREKLLGKKMRNFVKALEINPY